MKSEEIVNEEAVNNENAEAVKDNKANDIKEKNTTGNSGIGKECKIKPEKEASSAASEKDENAEAANKTTEKTPQSSEEAPTSLPKKAKESSQNDNKSVDGDTKSNKKRGSPTPQPEGCPNYKKISAEFLSLAEAGEESAGETYNLEEDFKDFLNTLPNTKQF